MVYTHEPIAYPLAAYHGKVQAIRVGARHGHSWAHLTADTNEELHAFAARLGMKRDWAQAGHYDLVPPKHALALQLGAVSVSLKECCFRIRALVAGRPVLHAPNSFGEKA